MDELSNTWNMKAGSSDSGIYTVKVTIDCVRTRASTQEAFLGLTVPLEHAALISGFMTKIGQQINVAFLNLDNTKPRYYRDEAQALRLSVFFYTEKVWKAVGTDAEYIRWVQKQKSVLSGDFSEWINGEGRCIAAHVRRAGESGMGYKAQYACIPLTDAEHKAQHHQGENFIANQEWFDEQRRACVQQWCWDKLKKDLGYDHWYSVPPPVLLAWAKTHEVTEYLPAIYGGSDESEV